MDVAFTCVAENELRYFRQARNLVLSIRRFGGTLSDATVLVNFVGDVDEGFSRELARLGAVVRVVARVDVGPPPSNKLRMLEEEEHGRDLLITLDCDTAVVGDFTPLLTDTLRAKIGDTNRWPDRVWRRVYRAVDLDVPDRWVQPTVGGAPMPEHYNSGVVLIPGRLRQDLRKCWMQELERVWSATAHRPWVMPRQERFFMEQLSFALAVQRNGFPITDLPLGANYPTHIPLPPEAEIPANDIRLLHYHRAYDEAGFIARPRSSAAEQPADKVNRAVAEQFDLPYDDLSEPPAPPRIPPLPVRVARRLGRELRQRVPSSRSA